MSKGSYTVLCFPHSCFLTLYTQQKRFATKTAISLLTRDKTRREFACNNKSIRLQQLTWSKLSLLSRSKNTSQSFFGLYTVEHFRILKCVSEIRFRIENRKKSNTMILQQNVSGA